VTSLLKEGERDIRPRPLLLPLRRGVTPLPRGMGEGHPSSEEEERKKERKKQDKNIMSTSATQGSHDYCKSAKMFFQT